MKKYIIGVMLLTLAGCAHQSPSPTDLELARLQRIQEWQVQRLELVRKQLQETEEKCNKARSVIEAFDSDIKL